MSSAQQLKANGGARFDVAASSVRCQDKFHRRASAFQSGAAERWLRDTGHSRAGNEVLRFLPGYANGCFRVRARRDPPEHEAIVSA